MTQKSLGFIPLIWVCAFCETRNPGPIKTCTSCGAPQPDDVEFLQVDEEQFNFIKDEALIRMAKTGPDIHCPFCGTRNPSTADLCSNCGGEIGMGGKARESGERVRTVGEAQEQPPAMAPEPKKARGRSFTIFTILGVVAVIGLCIFLAFLFMRTDDLSAEVAGVAWERSIAIEAYTTVTDSDWRDEVPEGAQVRSCTQEYRYTSEEPQPSATEVCGEEYVVDTGTGLGEVVQDCEYQVYDDYCEYTYMDWVVVESVTSSGQDLSPNWPATNPGTDQRAGERTESYTIMFSSESDTYTYTTTNVDLFMQAEIGSRWTLKINQLGGVQGIEPSN